MAYVVVPPPPLNQLLRYHVSETKQEPPRCALRQHRPPDEHSTVRIGHVISLTSSTSALGATTHLYARRREVMLGEVQAVKVDRQRFVRLRAIATHVTRGTH